LKWGGLKYVKYDAISYFLLIFLSSPVLGTLMNNQLFATTSNTMEFLEGKGKENKGKEKELAECLRAYHHEGQEGRAAQLTICVRVPMRHSRMLYSVIIILPDVVFLL
jgi:hypothetical protein